MKQTTRFKAVSAGLLCTAMTLAGGIVASTAGVQTAQAVPSYSEYQQKLASSDELKSQLAGVNSALQDKILQLNDLVENQIPAAQKAADAAADAAQSAKQQADAAAERLDAAQKDKSDLEGKIAETGANYDDAKAAVAQLARSSFHGSDASDVMDVVTNTKTTGEFVDKMQSKAAVTRSESEAANDAATTLSDSMNRKQRLEAIEKQIAVLKQQTADQAATAQQAASDASAKQASLNSLREEGSTQQAALESQQSQLSSDSAKEAAQAVMMKAQIDAYNLQLQQQRQQAAANAAAAAASAQGQYKKPSSSSSSSSSNSGSSSSNSGSSSSNSGSSNSGSGSSNSGGSNSGSASGMNYSVPGNCPAGATYCYGHRTGNVGNAYPFSQCTWWAYIRRQQLNLPVGSYLGNGQDWANSARALGYLVNHTPHVGAAISLRGGQLGANAQYGHVAIVEQVNANSIIISETGASLQGTIVSRTIYNPGLYWYVHY
ncbi:CHAP domain-containing protein [Bifidobacterium crudilactis]|jgi:surface antigen/chemotaxis protein histidine kinase CheA|uniref:CHAP domain-containing protein n=1 Tax=Bifidobacterium crudilactis TaxID=327277 RepID=UPI002F359116|nr:CHAP domain-containing protein [Bifidobacterium crudilactis]